MMQEVGDDKPVPVVLVRERAGRASTYEEDIGSPKTPIDATPPDAGQNRQLLWLQEPLLPVFIGRRRQDFTLRNLNPGKAAGC
jgi:hypothetical protein